MENTAKELTARLNEFIIQAPAPLIVQSGHFRLGLDAAGRAEAKLDPKDPAGFGYFPQITLEIGAQLIRYARALGKDAKLAFIVDDWSYARDNKTDPGVWNPAIREWFKGTHCYDLLEEHARVLAISDLSKDDVLDDLVPLQINKQGVTKYRNFGKYCSEKRLRNRHHGKSTHPTGWRPATCAEEYNMWLKDKKAQLGDFSLLSFIPTRCYATTCGGGLAQVAGKLPSEMNMHIYLPTIPNFEPERMFGLMKTQ